MSLWKRDIFRPLRSELGKRKLLTLPENLHLYGYDATAQRGLPVAVVMAETTDDVRKTILFARENKLTITPRGAGTGLSGGSVPVSGGIVISFERMNRIIQIDTDQSFAVVQPGVVTSALQEEAAKLGLFYPPDPSSYSVSTIGGNVAENAGGLRCFKYGVTGNYVLGIEYLDAKGNLYRTGALSEGDNEPDLTTLLIGSEGSLALFTRIALRLIAMPEKTVTLTSYFDESAKAFTSIEKIIQCGLVPSVLEYIDDKALAASSEHIGLIYPENAMALLLIELDGSTGEVEQNLAALLDLLKETATEVEHALDEQGRENLWRLRRSISPSLIRLSSGKIHEDVAVPRGSLQKLIAQIKKIEAHYQLEIPFYGHAGDGNLHVVVLFDIDDQKSAESAKEASKAIFRAALELDGTISGEHGIGSAKREYLSWQYSSDVMNLFKRVKRTLDPNGLFNPGKIL